MTTIEIDASRWAPEPVPDLPDLPDRWRRLRPVALAVVALLVLGLSGAAATPARITQVGSATLQTRILNKPFTIVEDVVLVPDEDRLSAYELRDGSPRWHTPMTTNSDELSVVAAGPGLALVATITDGRALTWALDLADGAIQWRVDGRVTAVGEIAVEAPLRILGGGAAPAGTAPAAEYVVRDLRTGRRIWALRGDPVAMVDQDTATAWAVSGTGAVTVHDLRDGRELRSGRLALPPGRLLDAYLVDGRLVLQTGSGESPDETYYDAATLAPVTAQRPVRHRYDCGVRWCGLVGPDDNGQSVTVLLDKATGAEVARLPAGHTADPSPAGLLVTRYGSPGSVATPQLVGLADPMTGAPVRDLTEWQRAWRSAPTLFLTREGPGGRLQIGRLAPGAGLQLLGELPHRVRACEFTPRTVVCLHDGNKLTFWRLR